PFKIEEAILKLLYNSLDAIEIFTGDKYDLPRSVIISLKTTDSKIIIEIADTGGGIDQNILEHIFDPFFTTKSNGKNLGLGLTIAKQIIEECNGDLQIISNLGIGTTAFLTLPLYKKNV
ncbi:MAG: HAMP domain-containing histidine kinase, partial [Desulfobacterales bacterium]|nr:HAMP domain-containing histidine kinase [Desulfobacterales bacterium]